MSDARLIVWDPATGDEIASFDLALRPVVSDNDDAVFIGIEQAPADDVLIRPEWAGMKVAIQVSPKAVTNDRMTAEVIDLARRMGVQVG